MERSGGGQGIIRPSLLLQPVILNEKLLRVSAWHLERVPLKAASLITSGLIPFHDADSCNFWCPFFRAFTRSSMESSKTNIRLGRPRQTL